MGYIAVDRTMKTILIKLIEQANGALWMLFAWVEILMTFQHFWGNVS